ncbi:MAG TPA: circularly permuted type 2 ATP-grasp protein [Polyangia bacterium]|nr:circularly permuted type 2 ATP-grasp protein [Polyangia bacterium]
MPFFPSRAAFADQQLLLRYPTTPDGSYDELVDPSGSIRPHWRTFVRSLEALGGAELTERWEQARQLIHDNGISFNVYGDARGMERPWQLSPIPVLIAADEFASLSAGLVQRARLFDRLLADLYGERRALKEGWLPPELVLGHPGYLRACHGLTPTHGRFLHFYAADLVRRPTGVFHVLTDRTQAPAGAGYALENRIVMSRVLPDVFRDCNITRLATFFRTVRETLSALAPVGRDNPRVVLLSSGPYNATYFEQAFLAQYLGYMLVDGADLTVRDSRVYLKTLGGLHPVDVILRRLNDDYCDPLELRDDSTLGIPGLLQSVRAGNVAVTNALGSGVLQSAAMIPFLPRICRGLLDEELKLPSVETWWCGDPVAREHVLGNLAEMVLKPAHPTGASQPIFGEALGPAARDEVKARVRAAPALWVAQARVPLSTTPVIDNGEIKSRQLVLRSFLVARLDGDAGAGGDYDVMPGALSLVGGSPTEREISMQRGAGSNDTWVVSGGPVSTFTLLPRPSHPVELSRGGGDLPSRVADNLFWLGRYSERADAIARLARTIILRLGETIDVERARESELGPLLAALREQTRAAAAGAVAPTDPSFVRSIERELLDALFAADHPGTLRSAIEATQRVARVVRDRVSMDTWRILTSLQQELAEMIAERAAGGSTLGTVGIGLDRVIMRLAALGGVVMESMTRGQAWRFLDMGRRLERAMNLVVSLRAALTRSFDREAPLLESVLDVADSGMTYRRRYLATLQVVPVVDLLVTDETNPRSVIFQLEALAEHLPHLPHDVAWDEARGGRATPDGVVAGAIARLRRLDLPSLCAPDTQGRRPALGAMFDELARELPVLSDALTGQYLSHAVVSRQLAEGDVR